VSRRPAKTLAGLLNSLNKSLECFLADAGVWQRLSAIEVDGVRGHKGETYSVGTPANDLCQNRNEIVGIISIRDIADFIVEMFPEGVLNVPPEPKLGIPTRPDGG